MRNNFEFCVRLKLIFLLLSSFGLGGAIGQEPGPNVIQWSQFRGQNAAGIAEGQTTVPVEFGPKKNLLWKTEVPSGASSPCIWENRIFLTAYDRSSKKLEVICTDRSNGKIVWRRAVEVDNIEKVHAASSPASGTAATDGEHVYVYFGSRGLLCYDFDGELIWSIDMPIPITRNGSGTSPVVVGDLVLLNRDQKNDPHLLAVDKTNGDVVWKHVFHFAPGILTEGYATPIIHHDQVILHTHEGIRAISLSEGKSIWQVNTITTGCSTPVIFGNNLFVATWQNLGEPSLRRKIPTFEDLKEYDKDQDGTIGFDEFPWKFLLFDRPEAVDEKGVQLPLRFLLGSVDDDKNRKLTQQEWDKFTQQWAGDVKDHGLLSIKLGGEGNVSETHVSVLEKQSIPEVPSPLVHDGRIYMIKNGGIVNCLDAETGKGLFKQRISARGSYYASPIVVGDNIYLTSGQGVVTVLRAADELDVIAMNDLSERIMATPAAVDGTLYIRTDEHLYAFSLR